METVTITETGCFLDNHRGHFITRDTIQMAVEWGFIVGSFEKYTLDTYDYHNFESYFPQEALIELCDEAVEWLNSGQGECDKCNGTGHPLEGSDEWYTHKDHPDVKLCRACAGTGRGPRISGQNFPPKVPKGYCWSFNDGDFGLYKEEELD